MKERKTGGNAVTVAVVTYNSAPLLRDFFAALWDALEGVEAFEVVVVDNDSRDDTLAVAAAEAPAATVIACDVNGGYAAGVNAAVAAAAPSEAVLVLNPDVRLGRGSVRCLLAALATPGSGIVVPRLLDADGRLAHSLRRDPTVLRALGEALLGGRRAGRVDALGEVVRDPGRYEVPGTADWATGAVMLVSRHCLSVVGPWDESFFLYSEETDFALRAREAGFALRYVPEAVAVHVGGEAPTSPRLWTMLAVNRVRFFARRHGRVRTAVFWLAVVLNEGLRALAGHATHRAALLALLVPSRRPVEVSR